MKKLMELNKETASRLWAQQFGRGQKAIDFSGREIAKAAYNDRNSVYGWNVDHILPQSRGGKTADYNLICCHILTNDEKADKFPCFKANEKVFEIQRRQNHYEIIARTAEQQEKGDETVNFLDAAQGLKCWKQCKARSKGVFVGYVKIKVVISDESVEPLERYVEFLRELFGIESIYAEDNNIGLLNGCYAYARAYKRTYILTVIVGDIPTVEDTENLLDDCVTLNTYNGYFINCAGFDCIQIACGMKCYDNYLKMSLNCTKEILDMKVQFIDSLMIDELVKINTSAKDQLRDRTSEYGFYRYNYTYTKLKNDLGKFI